MRKALLPLQLILLLTATSAFAQYVSSDNLQSSNPTVNICVTNQVVHKIEIEVGASPVTLSNLTFNTNGSTNPVTDISNAKLYYYNDSASFNLNQAIWLGTFFNPWSTNFSFLTAPGGSYLGMTSFSNLMPGKNYFWITFDIPCTAVPGNLVATCFFEGTASGTGLFTPNTSFCNNPGAVIVNPTGIIEKSEEAFVSIFPVPSEGNITLSLNAEIAKPVSIELLDVAGKKLDVLFDGIPEKKELNFSLGQYPPGIYMIRSLHEGKMTLSKVVIL